MLFESISPLFRLDFWSMESLLFLFFILGGMIVGLPLIYYARSYKSYYLRLQVNKQFQQLLMELDNRAWWLQGSGEELCCTRGFISILGLNGDSPVHLQDIINQFSAQEAHLLARHLSLFSQKGKEFKEEYLFGDDQTYLQIQASLISLEKVSFCLLTIHDVTSERKEREIIDQQKERLLAQKKWYEFLTNNIPLILWGRNSELRITHCNDIYGGILDMDPQQVIQQNKELVEIHWPNSFHKLAALCMETQQPQTRQVHMVIEGQRRLLEVTEVPLENKQGTIGYGLDLTPLEELSNKLALHESSHHQVLQNLSTPIAVYTNDTRLAFFNVAYQKLFEFEEKWLYQKPLYVEVLQDLRERRKLPEFLDFSSYRQNQLNLFNTLIEPMQELINQPDGKILRMMVVPHALGGLLFMFDDLSDKIAMERRYNTLIAVQKETIDHLYEGIVVLGSDNRLRLFNPAAAKLWGIDALDLTLERHAGEILYEIRHMFEGYHQWDEFRQKIITLFNLRQPITDRMKIKNGILIQYSYVPLPDGSHLLTFIDVSDRWRFEEALREKNDALEQADRFKSNFISHVSYELRAPLNSIIGFSEILLNDYFGTLNERQKDYTQGIMDSSQRLLGLINDIIDLSSMEAGKLSLKICETGLEELLSSLTRFVYNRSNDHGLVINLDNQTTVTSFMGDERRLKQVLFNLLMNAIKFTPAGGRIDLVVRHEYKDGKEYLCFSVQDTGVGIPPEKLAVIEALFQGRGIPKQAKNKIPGIGLQLAHQILVLHKGFVEIQSETSQGTTVRCYLPLIQASQPLMMGEVNKKAASLALN